jgi:hypothetical protein
MIKGTDRLRWLPGVTLAAGLLISACTGDNDRPPAGDTDCEPGPNESWGCTTAHGFVDMFQLDDGESFLPDDETTVMLIGPNEWRAVAENIDAAIALIDSVDDVEWLICDQSYC